MATTISNLNEARIDNKIVSALRYVLPALRAFSYVIENEDRIISDTVGVPLATDPTVGDKTAGTMVSDSGTLNSATITYNRFRGAGWKFKEGEIRPSLFPTAWEDKIAGAVYGAAKDAIDYALSLVTIANFGDTAADKLVVAPADFSQNDAAALWGKATTKIKRQQKTLLLNTDYASALFGNSNVALIYANAGDNILKSGVLPGMLGLDTMHYGDFPANGQNLGGAVFGKSAIALGIARPGAIITEGSGDVVERRVVTDPESGLSVLYTMTMSGGGSISGEVCLLYGAVKAQDAIVRLVSV